MGIDPDPPEALLCFYLNLLFLDPQWYPGRGRWGWGMLVLEDVGSGTGSSPHSNLFWVRRTMHMLTVRTACLTWTTGAWEYVGNRVPMAFVAPPTPIEREESKGDHRFCAWSYQPVPGTSPSFILV